MGAQLTGFPGVRETTLRCALSKVKRVFVVVVLATVSYSWPNPKRSLTDSSSSSNTFGIALEVVVVYSRSLCVLRIEPPLPAFADTVKLDQLDTDVQPFCGNLRYNLGNRVSIITL